MAIKSVLPDSSKTPVAKPFLKWAGGKSQLINTFQQFFPQELLNGQIENYYEPFVGGGAVFFHLAQHFTFHTASLYDKNPDLILAYRVIQNNVDELIEHLETYKNEFEKRDENERSMFYYEVRNTFNNQKDCIQYNRISKDWTERAAQLIFLNRTCFNGLFRFNSKGEFNVPAGRYKNPSILNIQNLKKASETLAIAQIKLADFRQIKNEIKKRSFIYYDPPYRPLNRTSNFTAYSKESFGDPEQKALAELFTELNKKGIKQMLSNSDPKNHNPSDNFFDDLYRDFSVFRVPARRAINSNASKRNAVNEIIVVNYPVNKIQ